MTWTGEAGEAVTPTVIAENIGHAWAAHLARSSRRPDNHSYVYASSYRNCARRMCYELTHADQQPVFPPEVLAKFRRGEDRERDLLMDLTRIGRDAEPPFKIIGQQERFVLKDRKNRAAIVGKVDARLDIEGQHLPLEVKAWSPHLTDRIECFEDLFGNPWTQSGGYQLLSYLFGSGMPFGFLLLDRSGLPRLVPVELEPNLNRMEAFLTRAEQTLDHVAAGTLPDYHDDAAECRRCSFYGAVCNPPLAATGAAILTDPELEAQLERREELRAAGEEYAALDKTIKAQLRGVEFGIAGHFQITGQWGKQSRVDLPPDLKKQYTITDPKGRFTLEITRL